MARKSAEDIIRDGERYQAGERLRTWRAWELCKAHAQSWNSRFRLGVDIPLGFLASPSLSGEPQDDTEYVVPVPIHLRKTQPLKEQDEQDLEQDLPIHLRKTQPLPEVQETWYSLKPLIMEWIDTKPETPVIKPMHTTLKAWEPEQAERRKRGA